MSIVIGLDTDIPNSECTFE